MKKVSVLLACCLLGVCITARAAAPSVKAAATDTRAVAAYYAAALECHFAERFEEAIAFFEKALALLPDSPRIYADLAQAQIRGGKKLEGLKSLQKAFTLGSEDFEVCLWLSFYFLEARRTDDAITAFERLVGTVQFKDRRRLNVLFATKIYGKLAQLYIAKQNHARAVAVYGKLVRIYESEAQFGKALTVYREMRKLSPRHEAPYLGAARLLRREGKHHKAVAELQAAVKAKAAAKDTYLLLGDIYGGQDGKEELALAAYRKALAADKANLKAYYCLVVMYTRLGKLKDAAAALEKARALNVSKRLEAIAAQTYPDEGKKILEKLEDRETR